MRVFLDDERPTPEGWVRTYSVEETLNLLCYNNITELSVDNDLGEGKLEGYKVLDELKYMVVMYGYHPPRQITVHSNNAARVKSMKQTIESIKKRHSENLLREVYG